VLAFFTLSYGQDLKESARNVSSSPGILEQAVVCEKVVNGRPINAALVFSAGQEEVFCFTSFSSVDKKDFIVHNWFRRDERVARIKLTVEPPRWATYSGITLRDTDKGPWRVEITDSSGNVLKIIRFSITE